MYTFYFKFDWILLDYWFNFQKIEEIEKFLKQLNEKLDEKKEEINDEISQIDNLKSEFAYIKENCCNLKIDKQKVLFKSV